MSDRQKDNRSDSITSGPLLKAIIALALPVTAGMLMEVSLSVTDFYWVGRLGAIAQDAVTSSMVIIWTMYAAISIISIGVTALVARYIGAKNTARAGHYIRQSVWLTYLISGTLTIGGYLFTPAALEFMDAGLPTQAHAIPYLRIFFGSCLFLTLSETLFAVFRASGDTKTPMKVGITVVLINMALDPLLIFGLGPIPPLGVAGASVATAVSHGYGLIAIWRYLKKGHLGYRVDNLHGERPSIPGMLKIARIGLPIASQQLVFVVVYWFLIKYVHDFGEAAGAAMGIGNRMESISYLTCYGFSIAASTLVGQNLGAGRPNRAAKGAWGASGLGIGFTLILSAIFIGAPGFLAGLFTNDPHVREIAMDYLIILGLSQSAMAIEIIIEGAFSGAGDTMPPMIVAIPGAIARIPLAYYLAFTLDWGINGIWWTLTITCILKAIVLGWWFWLGKWKSRRV